MIQQTRPSRCSNGPWSARPRPGFQARGERTSGARESNAVSPAPKAGGLPSPSPQMRPAPLRGRDGSRCPLWSCQRTGPDARVEMSRGGRTRTHFLRFWRPACKPGAPHPWGVRSHGDVAVMSVRLASPHVDATVPHRREVFWAKRSRPVRGLGGRRSGTLDAYAGEAHPKCREPLCPSQHKVTRPGNGANYP